MDYTSKRTETSGAADFGMPVVSDAINLPSGMVAPILWSYIVLVIIVFIIITIKWIYNIYNNIYGHKLCLNVRILEMVYNIL